MIWPFDSDFRESIGAGVRTGVESGLREVMPGVMRKALASGKAHELGAWLDAIKKAERGGAVSAKWLLAAMEKRRAEWIRAAGEFWTEPASEASAARLYPLPHPLPRTEARSHA